MTVVTLARAIAWRLWREQRLAIVLLPLLLVLVLAAVVLATQFAPGMLTGPTLEALRAATRDGLAAPAPNALARAFVDHQAPYLLALFAGMAAASVSAKLIGDDADRGSLELLLATCHDVREIGAAALIAATSLAGVSWAILWLLSAGVIRMLDAALGLHLAQSPQAVAATVAMQFVLALLSAEITLMTVLLWPALARLRTGVTGDPVMLIGALPPLAAFIVANLFPALPVVTLSLSALAIGGGLLVVGALTLHAWFRPERFLES